MNKGLEINVEIGLCTKEMAKENPIKDFEILIEEYKDKWSKQMYGYFKECVSVLKKELKELEERREMMRRFNEACVPMILDNETEKKLKALEIIKENSAGIIWKTECSKEDIDFVKEVLL